MKLLVTQGQRAPSLRCYLTQSQMKKGSVHAFNEGKLGVSECNRLTYDLNTAHCFHRPLQYSLHSLHTLRFDKFIKIIDCISCSFMIVLHNTHANKYEFLFQIRKHFSGFYSIISLFECHSISRFDLLNKLFLNINVCI